MFETMVYRHLREAEADLEAESLGYWRPNEDREIDFVLSHREGPIPIEVTTSGNPRSKLARVDREMKALRAVRALIVHGGPEQATVGTTTLVPIDRFLRDPVAFVRTS